MNLQINITMIWNIIQTTYAIAFPSLNKSYNAIQFILNSSAAKHQYPNKKTTDARAISDEPHWILINFINT